MSCGSAFQIIRTPFDHAVIRTANMRGTCSATDSPVALRHKLWTTSSSLARNMIHHTKMLYLNASVLIVRWILKAYYPSRLVK